ncbi:MAG: hypothetical protein MUF49_14630 [Oculatellaceae cyanobacterium Prado106]|jgi:hypothetical protein|nr:hypothetical protein [Oculatellaceae cyanobacterium Prado106]
MNLSPVYLEWHETTFQEGRQEGRQESDQDNIRGLLEARFGVLDGDLEQIVVPLMGLAVVERSRLILQSSREELLARFSNPTES